MIGIYKITNLINNKIYIGQSRNIEKRWKDHTSTAFNEFDHAYNYPLYKAIRKYGIENFKFEVIEECSIEELNKKEIYWIEYYDSFFHGYNQTLGGDNTSVVNKEKIIGIISDLENTQMFHKDIAKKWGISIEMVQGINTGRYWKQNREYPIQKPKENKYPTHNYCIDCGKEIFRTSTRCVDCEAKRRSANHQDKVTREELKQLIRTTPFTTIGKNYGVSDNAVRKWCDKFNLPRKSSDIKKYSDKEWEQI